MKQYQLAIYQPDGPPPPPEEVDLERVMGEIDALLDDLKSAGAWVFNGALHEPSTATVVRSERDAFLVTDGPYTEGKEHVGGFVVVKATDLDAALTWARRLAGIVAPLPIEVRPFQGEVEG